LIEDYIVAASAAVITASVIVLISLLPSYVKLVRDARRSGELAKDLWNSVNGRLSDMDMRIIDVMAKVDVYGVKSARTSAIPSAQPAQIPMKSETGTVAATIREASLPQVAGGQEVDKRILEMLSQGPKTSGQIKQVIGKSREHTARLMKILFEKGLVTRNDETKPYMYQLTESGKRYFLGNLPSGR
jgi:DNA-binding transcriptional ArsR family regulator